MDNEINQKAFLILHSIEAMAIGAMQRALCREAEIISRARCLYWMDKHLHYYRERKEFNCNPDLVDT